MKTKFCAINEMKFIDTMTNNERPAIWYGFNWAWLSLSFGRYWKMQTEGMISFPAEGEKGIMAEV